MGVFSKNHNPETSLKRNTVDMSFRNHVTTNLGAIIPIFCKDVMNGDTVDIDIQSLLRFMPTYFPVQNRIRADVHAFYVRSRNLYKNYKNFQTNQLPSDAAGIPYLAFYHNDSARSLVSSRLKEFCDGGLADYLNIPTRAYFSKGKDVELLTTALPFHRFYGLIPFFDYGPSYSSVETLANTPFSYDLGGVGVGFVYLSSNGVIDSPGASINIPISDVISLEFLESLGAHASEFSISPVVSTTTHSNKVRLYYGGSSVVLSSFLDNFEKSFLEFFINPLAFGSGDVRLGYVIHRTIPGDNPANVDQSATPAIFESSATFTALYDYDLDLSSINFIFNPWDSNTSSTNYQPISALPFRAYESCYNAFFRDDRNNPLLINGQPVYDVYCRNTDGGADYNDYPIYYRNWEQDAFTTALPSPQQGQAPLVGLVDSSTAYVSDPDSGKVYMANMKQTDDGLDVSFTETNQDTTAIPSAVARSLVSVAASGISINDFRNVNALQRFLELNMMRGRKYKDVIEARWGVNISYAELDMPEFIGGFSFYSDSFQINQTSSDVVSSPLGSYAGQLAAVGNSKNKIHHYCDEVGYILITLSVVPVPVYTQCLPPMFTRFKLLDYFQPEFGHIGLQPISNSLVAPIQYSIENNEQFNETFGYQRAYWDYLSSCDEAHGQFRNSLRDFVMYRQLSSSPRLSTDFLTVDPSSVDNVFSVQTDADGNQVDKILGFFQFDAKFRRPIPLYGVPRLE